MDIKQQVRNYYSTMRQGGEKDTSSKREDEHQRALQELVNGGSVKYQETLRVVNVESARQLNETQQHRRRSPGYIRNESGGFFTA